MVSQLINARSETVTEKTSFRSSAAKRRTVIPANGYYEWMKTEAGKTPYFLHGDMPTGNGGRRVPARPGSQLLGNSP